MRPSSLAVVAILVGSAAVGGCSAGSSTTSLSNTGGSGALGVGYGGTMATTGGLPGNLGGGTGLGGMATGAGGFVQGSGGYTQGLGGYTQGLGGATTGLGGATTGAGGSQASDCVVSQELVNETGWVGCDPDSPDDDPAGIQGAWYAYGDDVACSQPEGNPCTTGQCCLTGSTIQDDTYAAWGCGIGLELNATGGDSSVKQPYDGEATCFSIALSGNSGGNAIRIGLTQFATPDVSPYVEIPALSGSWEGEVCIADVSCPSWADADTCSVTGENYDIQVQIVGGERDASVELCVTSMQPNVTIVTPGSGGATGSGGAATGSGGATTGSGGAATGAGGTTGLGGQNAGGSGNDGGYHVSGPWAGYAWTAVGSLGSTITPDDFGANAPTDPYCASGSVVADADFGGVAMVGFNLNQAQSDDAPIESWTPSSETGIVVNITNTGGSDLRVQIQSADGETNPDARWCAPISEFGTDVFIPWDAFNTECWNNGGNYYDGEPLTAVLVMVPGDDTAATPFDFCVNSVGVQGGSGGTGGSTGTGGSGGVTYQGQGTLTDDYDWSYVQRNGQEYVVQNNVWGGNGTQTVTYYGTSFEITAVTGSGSTDGSPLSFPSAFIGSNNSRTTNGSNLPIVVSSISSIPTSWTWASNGASGDWNAAYDVWFSSSSGGENDAAMLMVWLYDPANAQPVGSLVGSAVIEGVTYAVWYGSNGGIPVVSYVRNESATSVSFDLNNFIQDAVSLGYVPGSSYLTSVFAGFEIWSGGQGLETVDFAVSVN